MNDGLFSYDIVDTDEKVIPLIHIGCTLSSSQHLQF